MVLFLFVILTGLMMGDDAMHKKELPFHRENNFDFLRMVAASMVLYSHHFVLSGRMYAPDFFGLHSYGTVGVWMFFAMSGYLVTQSWYSDPHVIRFALRRFLRIWPAFTVVVCVAALILGPLVSGWSARDYFMDPGWRVYLKNLWMDSQFMLPGVFGTNPFQPPSVNGSIWTIPIEVACYIIFAFLGFVGLWKRRSMLVLMAFGCLVLYFYRYDPAFHGESRYEFVLYFFLGASLFVLRDFWLARPLLWGFGVLAAGALAFGLGKPYLGLALMLPYAVIRFGVSSTPIVRAVGRYGDLSYGTYLFAFPVQQTVIQYLHPQYGLATTMALSFAVTLLLAFFSWHWVEKPALRMKPRKPAP